MSETWITSDLHLCHEPAFVWEPRGFKSCEEMNDAIVERWNSIVKPDDMVFLLGDITLNNTPKGVKLFKKLNGTISIIWGNHDTLARQKEFENLPNVIILGYAHCFKYHNLSLYLSHYPTLTANYDEKYLSQHVINLHGHTHQQANFLYPNNPFMYHVGVDSHNCYPVNLDEIIVEIKQRWQDLQTLKIPMTELYSYPQKDFN